jgi:hypothetical protein
MEALNIYYLHYGILEQHQRKKIYAIQKLMETPLISETYRHQYIIDKIRNCHYQNDTCRMIKYVATLMDHHYLKPTVSFFHLNKCYRNHIYPAEIKDSDSVFYKANLYNIDAILIDRDPSYIKRPYKKRGKFFDI